MFNFYKRNRLIILISLLVTVLAGSAVFCILYIQNHSNKSDSANQSSTADHRSPTQTTTQPAPTSTPALVNKDTDITWITPVKLDRQEPLFRHDDDIIPNVSSINYYHVADLKDGGQIILATIPFDSTVLHERFMKDVSGHQFTYLWAASDNTVTISQGNVVDLKTLLNTKIKQTNIYLKDININSTLTFSQLDTPETLISNKNISYSMISDYGLSRFFSDITQNNPQKIDETSSGPIYQIVNKVTDAPMFAERTYYLKSADSLITNYILSDSSISGFTSSIVPDFNLLNGSKSDVQYDSALGEDRTGNTTIIANPTGIQSRLTPYGKTASGSMVYTLKNPSDPIVKASYAFYAKNAEPFMVVTQAEYIKNHPVIIWQDPAGDYEIFAKSNYVPMHGLGKPVIYLYPPKTTKVSLKVGATIVKSDPLYNNGWDVVAKPSGEITLGGKTYDSLYWEGYGHEYPSADTGFVVKQSDLASTLNNHLDKLGLTGKEKNDFLAFWLPKLPKSPYLRLTWFLTPQLNKLAPLTVSPKPDNMIRIFLDYAPLQKPYSIKPQKLLAPKRIGFTLVEWGGLLMEKIK